MLDKLQSADFSGCLNQVFRLRLEDLDPIPLELTSVTELGAAHVPGGRRPFSLLFLGPPGPSISCRAPTTWNMMALARSICSSSPLGRKRDACSMKRCSHSVGGRRRGSLCSIQGIACSSPCPF